MNFIQELVRNRKGATAVEYAFILVAILIAVSGAYKALGPKVGTVVIHGTSSI